MSYRSQSDDSARSPATHSYTLDRGLRALAALAEHPEGLTVSELAAELHTHRPAVYRLLGPLTAHNLVRRTPDGLLRLGSGLIALASAVGSRLQPVAEPILQELADRLGVTTALTVRDGDEAVVAAVLQPRTRDIHLTYRQGMRHDLGRGAPGHALLAAQAPATGEPTDVATARSRGYAITRGQLLDGATGVAAAVPTPAHEPAAAISAVWITGVEAEQAAQAVIAAAAEIGRGLQD